MESIVVKPDDKRLLKQIEGLYLASFPETERRPWSNILEMTGSHPFFSMHAFVSDNGIVVGFYTLWRLPDAYYIEHLAVNFMNRCMGVGSAMLAEVIDIAGSVPVVVEVELPEQGDEAQKRIGFYRKNGFAAMEDFPYFQPPYRADMEEVPLMLMTHGTLSDPEAFVIMLHTLVYNQ